MDLITSLQIPYLSATPLIHIIHPSILTNIPPTLSLYSIIFFETPN